MKNMKKPVILWGIAGIVLSLCTLIAAVYGMNSSPVVLMDSTVILETAEQTLECARSGDLDALEQLLYGTPDLGESPEKSQEAKSLIWYAYLDSMEYRLGEECYASGSGMAVDVSIHCLDISAVTEAMQAIVPTLMTQAEAETASEAEISKVLSSAAAQVLAEQSQMMDREITLNLVRSNGRWQVVPTEALQQFLSGFVSE